jgi:manganese/zinc/iron transport system permease protein
VALLYRVTERNETTLPSRSTLQDVLLADSFSLGVVLRWLRRRGDILGSVEEYRLTEQGTMRARGLVRSHRLWEQYLVSQAGVAAERSHDQAEQLEHFTDQRLRQQLDEETHAPQRDPHGSIIPAEPSERTTGPGQV